MGLLLAGGLAAGCGESGEGPGPGPGGGGGGGGETILCDDDTLVLGEADYLTHQEAVVTWDAVETSEDLAYSNEPLVYWVPDDARAVHFTVEAPDEVPVWLDVRLNGTRVDGAADTGEPALARVSIAWPDTVSLSLPSNEKTDPRGRCVELTVGSFGSTTGGEARVSVVTNRFREPRYLIPSNVAWISALDPMSETIQDAVVRASTRLQDLAGISLAAETDFWTISDLPGAMSAESDEFNELMAMTYDEDYRLNIAFVERLEAEGLADGYSLLGLAGGIPAAPFSGTAASSLVIAIEPHMNAEGTGIYLDYLASTITHEVGHMLGLFHTTEQEGSMFDAIADTPECRYSDRDANGDDLVTFDECEDAGAENLMFWEANSTSPVLSATQREVLRNAVLVRSRETTALVGDLWEELMARELLMVSLASALIAAGCAQGQTAPADGNSPALVTVSSEGGDQGELGRRAQPLQTGDEQRPSPMPAPAFEANGAPEGTDAFAARLRAHHAEDRPGVEALEALPDAAGTLLAIEANALSLGERTAVLRLMRGVDDARTRARLLEILGDESLHSALREAAAHGLSTVDLDSDDEGREALERAAQSEDPRVRDAARSVLEQD